jgi:hypothetical protein
MRFPCNDAVGNREFFVFLSLFAKQEHKSVKRFLPNNFLGNDAVGNREFSAENKLQDERKLGFCPMLSLIQSQC